MEPTSFPADWKLKLKSGIIKTVYKHYSVVVEGVGKNIPEEFSCPPGKAFMSMKTWSSSTQESSNMAKEIGNQIGFKITRKVDVYETEPTQPPQENPFGYDISFAPFE